MPDPIFPKAADHFSGRSIGGYHIIRRLSVGGMAEVFLAYQQGIAGFSRLVVLKRLLPTFSRDPEYVRMFLHEAKIASQLRHPNIVQVHDLGTAEGELYQAV